MLPYDRRFWVRIGLILVFVPWVLIIVGVYSVLHYFGGK